MIPPLFLTHLSFTEFLGFQVVHTILHFFIILLFLYLGQWLILRDKNEIEIKHIFLTGLIIELCDAIISFYSNFLLIGGSAAFPYALVMIWLSEFIIISLRYYEKGKISKTQTLFLIIVTFIPSLILSIILTSLIFELFGISNAFFSHFI